MKQLTLIIPAKHESDSLPSVLEELKKFNVRKIIIIDKTDKKTKTQANINLVSIKIKINTNLTKIQTSIRHIITIQEGDPIFILEIQTVKREKKL
jgi:homospermidine synthase